MNPFLTAATDLIDGKQPELENAVNRLIAWIEYEEAKCQEIEVKKSA